MLTNIDLNMDQTLHGRCNIFISTNVNIYNICKDRLPGPVPHNRIQIKERREEV